MTVNEILQEALSRIEREHGVAITELRADWIDYTMGGSIRRTLSYIIEIESKVGDKE